MRSILTLLILIRPIFILTYVSSDTDVNIYYNLTMDNSLIINISISYPHGLNISEGKLTMYNHLSTNILSMDLFHISEDLCAQIIKQALKCTSAVCVNHVGESNISLLYSSPAHSVFGIWYFKLKYYDNVQRMFKMVEKELNLNQYALVNEKLKLKLKIRKLTADKVELLCYCPRPFYSEPISKGFPLTKVGFGLNNLLYFGDLYQRKGSPFDPRCTYPLVLNSTSIHDKNDIKCFDVVNFRKDNRLCRSSKDRLKPLFLFSDRQDIPNYFAGNLSFVNPTTYTIYNHMPQNIIIESDIRSCFQVHSENNNNKNLCLPSPMILEWISQLARFVIQYESVIVWSSNLTDYQCPTGKILTILTHDCLENHPFTNEGTGFRTCNKSAGFTIYHNDTLHLKLMEKRNDCIINFILCFQNLRQRPRYVYLFPSSKPVVRPIAFNPVQVTNLKYVLQCPPALQEQNLLELEDEILANASSMAPNILVKNGPLHCSCEEKPFTCFVNNTRHVSSEYPVATMTFNIKDINPNSLAFCFIDNIKSSVINLNNQIIYNVCQRHVSHDLRDLYAPIHLAYSVSPDFPLVTFNCTNSYIGKKKKACGLKDQYLMMVTLESQYKNTQSISRNNITINLNHLVDDTFNRISCLWHNSSVQRDVPIRHVITSVMETYCSSLHSPYKLRYTYYNDSHVQCIVRSINPACFIQPLKIEIGPVSCSGHACMENLRTERLLITNISSTSLDDSICTVYYRYHNPQKNVIPVKQTRLQNYVYKSSSISFQKHLKPKSSPCSLRNTVPTIMLKRYFKHVLVTTFLETDCTKHLPFSVNISIFKLNSIIPNYDQYNIIHHKTISSKVLQQQNMDYNNSRPNDENLHFWYDKTDKTILISISDSFIHNLIKLYQSPIVVLVQCLFTETNITKKLEIPAWMFKNIYKDQYSTHLQDVDKYTWPNFKPKGQIIFEKDQVGLFLMKSLPVTVFVIIILLIIIISCVLCHVRPLVKERSILQHIYRYE